MSRREWAWIGVAVGICLTLSASRLLPYDVFLALVGVLIGAVISGAISWHFYRQASDDQKDIHAQTASMLQSISGGHKVTVDRDEQGNTLVTHHITIADQTDTTDSVQVSTGSAEGGDPRLGG